MYNPVDYLNSSVWCKLGASSIQGVGVIAIRDIPKGTKITDLTLQDMIDGKRFPYLIIDIKRELPLIKKEIRDLILDRIILQSDHEAIICISPNHEQILQTYMNHSENPNWDGSVTTRDIKAGEEITENFLAIVPNMHQVSKDHMPFLFK